MRSAFRDALLRLDVGLMRRLWAHVAPHLPQPADDAETLHTMHQARVRMERIPEADRRYSEAWLKERDAIVKKKVVSATGAASSARDPGKKSAIEDAMIRAADEARHGGLDPNKPDDAAEIRRLMLDARAKVKAGRVSV